MFLKLRVNFLINSVVNCLILKLKCSLSTFAKIFRNKMTARMLICYFHPIVNSIRNVYKGNYYPTCSNPGCLRSKTEIVANKILSRSAEAEPIKVRDKKIHSKLPTKQKCFVTGHFLSRKSSSPVAQICKIASKQ